MLFSSCALFLLFFFLFFIFFIVFFYKRLKVQSLLQNRPSQSGVRECWVSDLIQSRWEFQLCRMVYIIDYYHYHTIIFLWGMVGEIKPWSHIRYSLYFQKKQLKKWMILPWSDQKIAIECSVIDRRMHFLPFRQSFFIDRCYHHLSFLECFTIQRVCLTSTRYEEYPWMDLAHCFVCRHLSLPSAPPSAFTSLSCKLEIASKDGGIAIHSKSEYHAHGILAWHEYKSCEQRMDER